MCNMESGIITSPISNCKFQIANNDTMLLLRIAVDEIFTHYGVPISINLRVKSYGYDPQRNCNRAQ
jgi:hypothetical protein